MNRPKLSEGTIFAVPLRRDSLRRGGWSLGLVSRHNRRGILSGYFFRPRIDHIPAADKLKPLDRSDIVMVAFFSDREIADGSWPIVGTMPDWDRDAWAVTRSYRVEPISNRYYLVLYDDKDPLKVLGEARIAPDEIGGLPSDALRDPAIIEDILNDELNPLLWPEDR